MSLSERTRGSVGSRSERHDRIEERLRLSDEEARVDETGGGGDGARVLRCARTDHRALRELGADERRRRRHHVCRVFPAVGEIRNHKRALAVVDARIVLEDLVEDGEVDRFRCVDRRDDLQHFNAGNLLDQGIVKAAAALFDRGEVQTRDAGLSEQRSWGLEVFCRDRRLRLDGRKLRDVAVEVRVEPVVIARVVAGIERQLCQVRDRQAATAGGVRGRVEGLEGRQIDRRHADRRKVGGDELVMAHFVGVRVGRVDVDVRIQNQFQRLGVGRVFLAELGILRPEIGLDLLRRAQELQDRNVPRRRRNRCGSGRRRGGAARKRHRSYSCATDGAYSQEISSIGLILIFHSKLLYEDFTQRCDKHPSSYTGRR